MMKCIVLAGGSGDRLWPLSRKNYPKQFMQMKKNHSIFQDTIARNIPYCDEFVIVTNKSYENIVKNQMSAFQGITYQCIFEEISRKTTAAIILACMQFPLSEAVFVVPSDQLVDGEGYKDDLMHAKELCRQGSLVTFGKQIGTPEPRFGYIRFQGEEVLEFTEKPTAELASEYKERGDYLMNSGMFLFFVGDMLRELKLYANNIYYACGQAFKKKISQGSHWEYSEEVLKQVPAEPIEKVVFEQTRCAKVVSISFTWTDIGSLEDLQSTQLELENEGIQVQYNCRSTDIVNRNKQSVVVANGVEDVIIVNTEDAVYVGKYGASEELKAIMEQNHQINDYFEKGRITYRPWGNYEQLVDMPRYRVRKLTISAGKTIYAHQHAKRSEHWSIVQGYARIILDAVEREFGMNDAVVVQMGTTHQISNIGKEPLVIIEVAVGEAVSEEDMVSIESRDLTEAELGYTTEPFVKLQPVYKDFLWGGIKLKTLYGKSFDYDIVAESWELSAHEAGQSIVASGRHRGLLFGEYLETVGKHCCGWKCQPSMKFPILIKWIDASQALSVQVHPDDEFALEKEQEYGKNEMWYVVDCEPDAYIYCGFSRDVTGEEVTAHLQNNMILELLNKIPVHQGDVYFIPAGTVHAVGEGMLLCEIQQSSNITYRLYDYHRTDRFGNYRELHVEKALQVLDYKQYVPQELADSITETPDCRIRTISRCKYFECVYYQIYRRAEISQSEESFASIICLSGEAVLRNEEETMQIQAGDSIFLPAGNRNFDVEGICEIIVTRV